MKKKTPRETDDADQPPRDIPVSTDHPELRYELAEELVANPKDSDPAASIRAASSPGESAGAADLGPVYRRVPSGDMVVPTGLVLVRFADGEAAEDHKDDLKAVGFLIEQVLPYATNTAWVRAATGGVTGSLRALDELGKVSGVVALEPQMVGAASSRK